jgi:hypothetical protein
MQLTENRDEVFTADEAADFLKCSSGALRDPEWRRRVGLQTIRIGKSLRSLKHDLLRFLEERKELWVK